MNKIFIIPNEQQALERISSRCAKSELCESDVRRKLSEWEQSAEVTDRIVARLRAEGFIDDRRFCHAFVEDKWKFNRWGRMKIRMALQQKGLRGDIPGSALSEIDPDEYSSVLSELLREKKRTLNTVSVYELRQKLIRFAIGRGFEPEIIKECLEIIADS